MEQNKTVLENELAQMQEDLGSEFPFSALWQDEMPTGIWKLLPIIGIIADVIMLVLLIILITKK